MKILLSLLIFTSFFGKASAVLFETSGSTASNNSANNYASVSASSNIEAEIADLKSKIAQKQQALQSQKQQQESKKLQTELAELKALIKQQNNNQAQTGGVPNIIINNSPTNTNTNTNTSTNTNTAGGGSFSNIVDKVINNDISDNRKHRLSVGAMKFGENLLGAETSETVPAISYSYIGDTFYFGGYYTDIDSDYTYNSYYCCRWPSYYRDNSISYGAGYGGKIGLSLFKQGNLRINPYWSYNVIEGGYDIDANNYYDYYRYTGDFDLNYSTIGADLYLDVNKSFALQIGVDYIIDQEIEILAEGATHSFDVSGEGSKFAKIYGGLAIKF